MMDEVRIDGFICRASYDIIFTKVNIQDRAGTAYCTLEIQKGQICNGIQIGFDFDFKVYWSEAVDFIGNKHTYVDTIIVEKLYRRYNISLLDVTYGAEDFNISKKEYCDIIDEAILKLKEAFRFRINFELNVKYKGYQID